MLQADTFLPCYAIFLKIFLQPPLSFQTTAATLTLTASAASPRVPVPSVWSFRVRCLPSLTPRPCRTTMSPRRGGAGGSAGMACRERRPGLEPKAGPRSALLRWPIPFCLQTSTKGGVFASLGIEWREEASQGFFQGTRGHPQCMDCSSDNGAALSQGGEAGGVRPGGSGWGALPSGLGAHQPHRP